jgi:hypothetical protein
LLVSQDRCRLGQLSGQFFVAKCPDNLRRTGNGVYMLVNLVAEQVIAPVPCLLARIATGRA